MGGHVPCAMPAFHHCCGKRCRRPCAVAAEAKYNIKDVAASNKKWTVYELAVQNFLMDAHRDGCMYVLALRIVVPTALRRLLCRLLRQRLSNPLQTLRRLLCRLLRQRQSIALHTLRRLLCQLLRQRQSTIYGRPIYSDIFHSYVAISPSGTVTVTVTDLAGHLSSTTSVGHPSRRVTTVFAQDHSCSDS